MVGERVMPPGSDRLLVVLSDIEMGPGGPIDDCPHSESIADLIVEYDRRHPDTPLELVFNGDTFDFLKTPIDGTYPRYISEEIARARWRKIAKAHGPFLSKLAQVLARPDRSATFVVGNHDFELLFEGVQADLRARLGPQVRFPGLVRRVGELRVEHGSQGDALFRINPDRPFLDHDGERILNLPWGAVGLIDAILPHHPALHLLDRIRPKAQLFQVLPEAHQLLQSIARRYWLGEYWHDVFVARDPLKEVRWEIIREVATRWASGDADVSCRSHYLEAARRDPSWQVCVIGHEHVNHRDEVDGRLLLTTGCLRSEFLVEAETGALRPVPRTIAEVWMRADKVLHASLVPVVLADPAPMPATINELAPAVTACLEEVEAAPELLPTFLQWLVGNRDRRSFVDG